MRSVLLFGMAFGLALTTVSGAMAAPSAPDAKAAVPKASDVKPAPKVQSKKVPEWTGTWSGSVQQVGRAKAFAFEVTLSGKGGTTKYPDEKCAGKLTRVGTSGNYAFFTETITEGKLDPATKQGCLDGSLTFLKDAGGLVMSWVAAYDGKPIVAYGTLAPTK